MKKLEAKLSNLISVVSKQLNNAKINSNNEVVEIELYTVDNENLNTI